MNRHRWVVGVLALVAPLTLGAQTADTSNALKWSGYVTSSYFYATEPTGRAIVGRLYDRFHDEIIANAARISLERPVATDKIAAGFRVDLLFGQNAAVIQSAGLKLGDHSDLPQAFLTLNLPTGGGNYVQFKAGKMWTLLDVEVVDEVLNPNVSHGYQYIYLTNFTNTGLGLDAKLSAKIDAQLRLINGWDVVEDNNIQKSFMGRVGITPSDRVALAFFGYYGPEQTDNITNKRYGGEFIGTLKPASSTTIYAQFDAGGEQGLGSAGGDATWWGAGLWGVFDLNPKLQLAIRGDYIDDGDGVRTSGVLGFGAAPSRTLESGTVTLNVKSWPHTLVRPEVRIEHSNQEDFGNPGDLSATQVTIGIAFSYMF
ncbi:MAG TPA: outer membrane beta-barrel protein [Gemmatimonadales bacterium]|nr:outer membrane beta-barrel protein [Gemmatimonadales bacterium]